MTAMITTDTVTLDDITLRMGTEGDRKSILQLQYDRHLKRPDFFFPFLTPEDDLDYNPEDCALTLCDGKLLSVGYVDMESEGFHELANRAKLSADLSGEIGAFGVGGWAENSIHRAAAHMKNLEREWILFSLHPDHEWSKKTVESLGSERVGDPFYPGGDKNHPLRQQYVAQVGTALSHAERIQERGGRFG